MYKLNVLKQVNDSTVMHSVRYIFVNCYSVVHANNHVYILPVEVIFIPRFFELKGLDCRTRSRDINKLYHDAMQLQPRIKVSNISCLRVLFHSS